MKLVDWLREAPFALTMSSGFFGFFAHTGVLAVLEDEGVLPVRVSGSSAGALVVGAWAAGLSAKALGEHLLALRRDRFWDPAPGPGLLRGDLFRRELEALLPVKTFAACRVPLAVSVFDLLSRRVRVVDQGPLAPALQASCAVPLLFRPVAVAGRPCLDGGVTDRPGLAAMRPGERVLFHHLASRSPWRSRASMRIPARANMTSFVLPGLPRVGPFRLGNGALAFEEARQRTRAALQLDVRGALVEG